MNQDGASNEVSNTLKQIDKQLLDLLCKRLTLLNKTAHTYSATLEIIKYGKFIGLSEDEVTDFFQSIANFSVKEQTKNTGASKNTNHRIAYLGSQGSYSHYAAHQYCQQKQIIMEEFGYPTFIDIIQSVENEDTEYGFLPIENTSSGSINEVFDLLQHTNLMIVGEITIDVEHCLLSKTKINMLQITNIYAHPQPISQCSHFLSQYPNITIHYCASSAEAMQKVHRSKNNNCAAIGSQYGGDIYHLLPIKTNIANQKNNQTRFIMVAKQAVKLKKDIPAKTTLIISTKQDPGALADALNVFKSHHLNLSKLESRPILGKPWQEMFYLDIEVNIDSLEMICALTQLAKLTNDVKILGCYPINSK